MLIDTLKAAVAKVDSMVAPFPTTPVSDAAMGVIAYVESLEARIAALETKANTPEAPADTSGV